jgi:hypothetical protein
MRLAPVFRIASARSGATALNRPLCSVTKRQKSVTPRRIPRGHHGPAQFYVLVTCRDEHQQRDLLARFQAEGL